jgi:propanol-preferring alcohol dehydrogenase
MRAARLHEKGAAIVIDEVPEPVAGPGEVVVKIAACGVCHSDLAIQQAVPGMPPGPGYPFTLGHENAGYVHHLGEGVTDFAVGDAVAVWPGWGDGTCRICQAGYEHICPKVSYVGVGQNGGWADYLLVPAARHLVPLGELDPIEAAPLTDAGLTAYGAVSKVLSRLQEPGRSVAIIGAGGLGQFAIKYLSAQTPATIVAVDIDAGKREFAPTIGAAYSVDPNDSDAATRLLDAAGDGLGVDAVIDFVGIDSTMNLATDVTAQTGRIVLVGIGAGTLEFGYARPNQEVELSTSSLGSREALGEVMRLWRDNGINARATQYALEDVNRALQDLADHKIAERGVLVL